MNCEDYHHPDKLGLVVVLHYLTGLLNGLLISFIPFAHLLRDHPNRGTYLIGLAVAIYVIFTVLASSSIWQMAGRGGWPSLSKSHLRPILVDGSNVMHWNGAPSELVLAAILRDLRGLGYTPLVYFDANVGYKLYNAYANGRMMAARLNLPRWQVEVVPSGVVADERLLERATRGGMQIVTNDRFLDWKPHFPRIGEHGFLIKGRWTGNGVAWRFPQDLKLLLAA